MNIDLLFTAVKQSDWRAYTETGRFEPPSLASEQIVWCFTGDVAEVCVNKEFGDADKIILIVIDPLRIEVPYKRTTRNGIEMIALQGTFPLDAIIDKIKLEKEQGGAFSIRVKHFD